MCCPSRPPVLLCSSYTIYTHSPYCAISSFAFWGYLGHNIVLTQGVDWRSPSIPGPLIRLGHTWVYRENLWEQTFVCLAGQTPWEYKAQYCASQYCALQGKLPWATGTVFQTAQGAGGIREHTYPLCTVPLLPTHPVHRDIFFPLPYPCPSFTQWGKTQDPPRTILVTSRNRYKKGPHF